MNKSQVSQNELSNIPKITKKKNASSKKQTKYSDFNQENIINPENDKILRKLVNKNISKNIKSNLTKNEMRQEDRNPSKSSAHKYSKTFTSIDEIPGVFTFINNQVTQDYSNKERSLSPNSGNILHTPLASLSLIKRS
jgi:hypothetical protein